MLNKKANKAHSHFDFKLRDKRIIKSKRSTRVCIHNNINKIVKCKRSQMKIQQMAFMLMAVFLFFILAGLFWLSMEYTELHKQATKDEEERAIYAASFLGSSAEFSCGDYCVDTDRLIILNNVQAYNKYKFWPYAYIEIRKIGNETEVKCNKDNYPNCNFYDVYDRGKQGTAGPRSYVSLCRREKFEADLYTKCELGFLIIGYEVK